MPFVNDEHRQHPDTSVPGDRCYLAAKPLWEKWQKEPRWTTIDEMWKAYEPDNNRRALLLALLVHMGLYGFDYEQEKREQNGEL